MKPMRPLTLALISVIVAAAGWLATVLTSRYGLTTPVLPATALVTMGVIVVLTLVLGLRVLRWRNRPRTPGAKKDALINPILAARTLVLAQACAYAGTVLLGWHAGIFLDQLRIWSLRSNQGITWLSLALTGGGVVMIVVGLLVERFCRIPPEEGDGGLGQPISGLETRKNKGEGEYAYRGD